MVLSMRLRQPWSRGHTVFCQASSISNCSQWHLSSHHKHPLLTHCSPVGFGSKVPKLNHKGTRTLLRPLKGFPAPRLCRQGCLAVTHRMCMLWLRSCCWLCLCQCCCCTQLSMGALPKASGEDGFGQEGNKAKNPMCVTAQLERNLARAWTQ